MKLSSKHIALGLIFALVLFGLFSVLSKQYRREPDITFSEFMAAVERNDQAGLTAALGAMLARARRGTPLPPDSLEPSDVIIPYEDATVDEVRKLLTDEGLIPG